MTVLEIPLRSPRPVAVAAAGRRGWRRRLVVLASIALVNVAVLGTDVYLLTQSNVTRPVTLDQALRRFQRTAGPAAIEAGPLASPTTGRSAVGQADTGAGALAGGAAGGAVSSGASGPGHLGATPARATGPGASAVSGRAPVAVPVLPAEGVYAYRTTGGEQIDILNQSHKYPAETFGTVQHQGGCVWQMENDVIQEHTDRRHFCSEPGRLLQLDQARYVTFFNTTDGMDYTCQPPMLVDAGAEAPNTARDAVCADTKGDQAAIHATDLGHEHVTVGGVSVDVVHLLLKSTLTGRARGTASDELLVKSDTGMMVSWHRSVDTEADASFGAHAHYTEHATFDLESLQPRT